MRNEWILEKGEFLGCGAFLGRKSKNSSRRLVLCGYGLIELFPSLNNVNKIKIKVTNKPHRFSIPIKLRSYINGKYWCWQWGRNFDYPIFLCFSSLYIELSFWLSNRYPDHKPRTVHVSIRKAK